MMTLLGGMGTFFGPFLGALIYLLLQDVVTVVTVHWQLVVGDVVRAPDPVLPARRLGLADPLGEPVSAASILEVEALAKRFGGFTALADVTARFFSGSLTSIIGPNGAGKSTFFNLISGSLAPSAGRIRFQGRDITGRAAAPLRPSRHREVVPDHEPVPAAQRARERARRRAGA